VRIDAHVHFWNRPELERYDWMGPEMDAIRRPFGPDDLCDHLQRHRFDRAVLVQTRSSLDETRAYLELAGATAFIGGVVGWVDLTESGVGETIAALRDGPGGRYLVGLRHQVHDEADPDWLRRDTVRRGLRALGGADLTYDLLVRTRELPAALDTVRAQPELRFVVDHIAKPAIAAGELEPWATRMAELARFEHVSCKLSGLVTEADWSSWQPEDIAPYTSRVSDWFGEERLIFGSDWPICTLAASYDAVVELAEQVMGRPSDRVFGGNAEHFYRLPNIP
jgi:L-fucono-1,5-lactonase